MENTETEINVLYKGNERGSQCSSITNPLIESRERRPGGLILLMIDFMVFVFFMYFIITTTILLLVGGREDTYKEEGRTDGGRFSTSFYFSLFHFGSGETFLRPVGNLKRNKRWSMQSQSQENRHPKYDFIDTVNYIDLTVLKDIYG